MNRRVAIFNQEDYKDKNYLRWWSLGLSEVYSIQTIYSLSEEERRRVLTVGEGDAVLLATADGWKLLKEMYHFGVRNEGFVDCQALRRLSIESGAFIKCIPNDNYPSEEVIKDFMSPEFTKIRDFSWFKQKVIKDLSGTHKFFDWAEKQSPDTMWGFDYEASGMALDKWFELSGFSLCTTKYGGFISLTDLRHTCSEEEYRGVLKRLGDFLVSRMDHIWAYNMQYEFQVSYRMLNVDLYNICDSQIINILDGYHLNKKLSLKITAQRVLGGTDEGGILVWDTEFDKISDLIDSMLFTEIGKTKAERKKVLRVTKDNFENTDEWKILCERYPKYVDEFRALILEYWGNAFMCIPSDILGYYCNLDAFYTLMIYEARKDTYSWKTFNVFLDNLRLACRLHSTGVPRNNKYRLEHQKFDEESMVWGITYCAAARCFIKMDKHRSKMADIKKYNPICRQLLENNKFFNGDPLLITKDILSTHIDDLDCTDTGLDEGSIYLEYGDAFAEKFIEIVKDAMKEVKMKTKIDEGIVRKKKILGIIAEKLKSLIGLDKLKLGPKHVELEKYMYYERAYKELMKVYTKQLTSINTVPEYIFAFGEKRTRLDYYKFVSDNYFKCASPIENDEICLEMAQLFPSESAFLAALLASEQQLPGTSNFYKDLGITNIHDAFQHFGKEYTKVWNRVSSVSQTDYKIEKIFKLFYQYYNDLKSDPVKDMWSDFDGYKVIEEFFPDVRNLYTEFEKPFDSKDMTNRFRFMMKFLLNYLYQKKNAKILSTYIDGMFNSGKWVIEDPETGIMIREADEGEPGAVFKLMIHFACMEKSSKRWSSGFHTIISKSPIKTCVITQSGYNTGYGYEAYGKPNQGKLLSYFDIGSAEVKSAGFASGDKNLIEHFLNGNDIYIHTAKQYLGEEGWNNLDKAHKKMWRKRFKTIFLGLLYGLGVKNLSQQLSTDEETAQQLRISVLGEYPGLKEYIEKQQAYPFNNPKELGTINTFFGDRLYLKEWDYLKMAKDDKERNNIIARIKRLAVNLVIQGGTSTAMSSGFFNDIREAKKQGWNLTSLLTVHDSNTSSFLASKLWEVRPFFDWAYTDWCRDVCGITLLFDILIGTSYHDACEMKQISSDVVQLKGNARSHLLILERLDHCDGLRYEIDIPRDQIIPDYINDPMHRFMIDKGVSFFIDKSNYTINYKKLS